MMKPAIFIFTLLIPILSFGQADSNNSFFVSYYGETVTHPGLRMGLEVPVGKFGKKDNTIFISPSFGYFRHRRYQTSFFVLPDFTFRLNGKKGFHVSGGAGIGFQSSFVPKTFFVDKEGTVHKITANHWYFLSNFFIRLDKSFTSSSGKVFGMFIKPQILIAYPNFPKRLGYFIYELGISHKISS